LDIAVLIPVLKPGRTDALTLVNAKLAPIKRTSVNVAVISGRMLRGNLLLMTLLDATFV
jgi:hypothetical protein